MSDFDEKDKRVFTAKHIWALLDDQNTTATIGVSDFLTEELDIIDSVDLPMIGDELEQESYCMDLHVNNRIYHFRCPMSGRCIEINKEVQDNPSLIHLNPNENWLFKMEIDNPDEVDLLMSAEQYNKFLLERY